MLIDFAVLLAVGALVFLPSQRHAAFIVHSTLLALLLVAVCWAKGEPPKWRWGEE